MIIVTKKKILTGIACHDQKRIIVETSKQRRMDIEISEKTRAEIQVK